MKIKEISENGIVFDNGNTLTYCHFQDCCEMVYADFINMQVVTHIFSNHINTNELEFDENLFSCIKQHECLGFTIEDVSGIKLLVSCYNYQNGYYSDELRLIYKTATETLEMDIGKCEQVGGGGGLKKMITKERLEELIKQKATIYECLSKEEINLSNICHIFPIISGKCIMDYKLLVIDERGCVFSYLLSWLKEDVETAKFEKRYQNITRTETLDLPTWEEMQPAEDEQDVYYNFVLPYSEKNKRWCLGGIRVTRKTIAVYKNYAEFNVDDNIIILEASKENYLEACEICRKLFLGEEVE